MTSIAPPPEFMPPSPFPMYEGYWTPIIPDREVSNPYVPIVSQEVWPDKQKFLDVVKALETYVYQFDNRSKSPYRRILHRGQIRSRLDPNVTFPVQEYWDMEQKIKWPAEYVGHYIGQFNVMPTRRFFEYVMYRMRNPFPGMPAMAPSSSSSASTNQSVPAPPPSMPPPASAAATGTSIAPPPEYGPPMVATQVEGNFQAGANLPVPSQMQWPDKQRFVQAVERLEDYMYQFSSTSGSPFYHRIARCIHTSLLEPSVRFGCHHFVDTERHMLWALGYAVHYIGKWNVMPTKRFFDYVMFRVHNPFPPLHTRPRPRPVPAYGGSPAPIGKRACHSKGDEPSPKGLGHCARDYAAGSVHRGKDRRQWIVAVDKNGRKYWKRHMGTSAGGPAGWASPAATAPAAAAAVPASPVIHEYWYAFNVIPMAMKFHEPSRTLTVKAMLKKQNQVTPATAHDALIAQEILKRWQNPASDQDGKTMDLNFFLDQEFSADRYATTTGISPWKVHSMRNAGTHVELTLVAQNHYLPLKSLKPAQYRNWKNFLQAVMSMEDADDGANALFVLRTTIGRPKNKASRRQGLKCRKDQIINPASGRCVSKHGKIGQRLQSHATPTTTSAGKFYVGEIDTMSMYGGLNPFVEIPVTTNFLNVVRANPPKKFATTETNAYVLGPLFPLQSYVKVGEHLNDAGETGMFHVPRGQTPDSILHRIQNGDFEIRRKHVVFVGETKGGDVGARVYVHQNSNQHVNSIIIDNNYFFPRNP